MEVVCNNVGQKKVDWKFCDVYLSKQHVNNVEFKYFPRKNENELLFHVCIGEIYLQERCKSEGHCKVEENCL